MAQHQSRAQEFSTGIMGAIRTAVDENMEAERLEQLGFTALEQGQVHGLGAGVDGISFYLTIPESAPAMTYAHEVSGNVYETRQLVVWLVDSRKHEGFHTVTLMGDFSELGAMVELEGWDDNVTLADAIETSEYLEAQGLRFTITGPNGSMLAY